MKFPTADVKRKEFIDYLESQRRGQGAPLGCHHRALRCGRSADPKLAATEPRFKKGDVLVEFDNTTVKQKLAQDQSALKSADAEIQQSRAAARLKEEKDLTDVMTADYDVRKTRMDASKQEILR